MLRVAPRNAALEINLRLKPARPPAIAGVHVGNGGLGARQGAAIVAGAAAGIEAAVPAHVIGLVALVLCFIAHNRVVMALVGIGAIGAVAAILIAGPIIGGFAQGPGLPALKQAAGRQGQDQQQNKNAPEHLTSL